MHIKGLQNPLDEGAYPTEEFVCFDSFEHEIEPHRLFRGIDQALIQY